MLYHLNLHFDPAKKECKAGHFVEYAKHLGDNIHTRSKQWLKRDTDGQWKAVGDEDTSTIVFKTGDQVVIAIGTPQGLEGKVEDVTFLISKDAQHHEDLPANPFENFPDNQGMLNGKPAPTPKSHGVSWTEFDLGKIQAKSSGYSSDKRHFRFTVNAKFTFGRGGYPGTYQATHDPVMEVDDGPRG